MKNLFSALIFAAASLFASVSIAGNVETIVFMRHGEKPDNGAGQLNCQGLNRSLALPAVLTNKFGVPDAIFAPNPGIQKNDRGTLFNYIRPLATIEPTAISLGLPVKTDYGFEDIAALQVELLKPAYSDDVVFVAWEHRVAEDAARNILKQFGSDPAVVPKWDGYDFDSLYILTIVTDKTGTRTAQFTLDSQGLNNLPKSCPF